MSILSAKFEKCLTGHGDPFCVEVDFETSHLTTVIFGPSGAGKTTLLRIVAGLTRPDKGHIRLNEMVFFDSEDQVMLPPFRRRLGMIFQQPSLFPHLSALDNVLYASPTGNRAEAVELLERFHVAHVSHRKPLQISGGEQQRVAIARSLAAKPRLLLLDEPLPGVDSLTRASVLKDLVDYQKEHEVPYLYVTHNRVEALRLGGRAILMDRGKIVTYGVAEEVFSSPSSTEASKIIGTDNVFSGTLLAHRKQEGLSEIDLGGVSLFSTPSQLPVGTPVAVTIPSTEIIVSVDKVARTSAQNFLSGRIRQIFDKNGAFEVMVGTPVPFRAHISPSALKSLALDVGMEVYLLIKAIAVVMDPL
jgi:molybdate transport system ATP-binding protein